jgi:hypothetical protein
MLRIEPALPMLRMDPALPKLKMLKRLLALIRPARFPAPARDRFFERAALCMTTSSYPGPYASSSQSSSIAGDLTPPERLAL